MKRLIRNLWVISLAFILLFLFLFLGVIIQQKNSQERLLGHEGENKLALKGRYGLAGAILDRNNYPLAYSAGGERYYADDPLVASSLVQIIGDYTHNIANTVEERYQVELNGLDRGFLKQLLYDFAGKGRQGSDLRLSLDADLCRKAAELISPYRASIVLLDYKTGEILVLVNSPFVAPDNLISWQEIPEGSLFNKALLGQYMPGSTFKLVTDAAWISSANFDPNYLVHCRGREPLFGPGSVLENRTDAGHGTLGRADGLAVSCNHYFGQVGVLAGSKHLQDTAENFAFNRNFSLDKISVATSNFKLANYSDDYSLSWLSIGQAIEGQELSITPLHLALISAGIANEGIIMEPILVKDIAESGIFKVYQEPKTGNIMANNATIDLVKSDMIHAVNSGMASSAALSGQIVGGKTGTAEYTNIDGNLAANALFTGFVLNDQFPLAIGLVVEGVNIDTGAIAGELFRYALEN